jgi:hypothetical protein
MGSLKAQLERGGFYPSRWVGIWFFPPFGKGNFRLPDWLVIPLLRILMPLDRLLRSVFPSLGHVLSVLAFKGEARD